MIDMKFVHTIQVVLAALAGAAVYVAANDPGDPQVVIVAHGIALALGAVLTALGVLSPSAVASVNENAAIKARLVTPPDCPAAKRGYTSVEALAWVVGTVVLMSGLAWLANGCKPAEVAARDAGICALECEATTASPLDTATLEWCAGKCGLAGAAELLRLLQASEQTHSALAAHGYVVPTADAGKP